jgi:hemerythrin-like metal-binding protein
MSIFPWMDKYSVHVESIDLQHKKLVDLLNTLAEAMSTGKGNVVLNAIFNELVDYTVYHFTEEEKYFDKIDYPQADHHLKEHKDLIEQASKLQADFESNKTGISIEVLRFLKKRLLDHISGTDRDLGKLLNKSGIK